MIHLFPNKCTKTLACKTWSKEKMCLKFKMLFSNLNKLSMTNLMFVQFPLSRSNHFEFPGIWIKWKESSAVCKRGSYVWKGPDSHQSPNPACASSGPGSQCPNISQLTHQSVETFEVVEVRCLQMMEKSESNLVLFYDFYSYSCM